MLLWPPKSDTTLLRRHATGPEDAPFESLVMPHQDRILSSSKLLHSTYSYIPRARAPPRKVKSRSVKGSKNADSSSPNSMSLDSEFDDLQVTTEIQQQRPKRLKRPTKSVDENLEPAFTASPSVVQEVNQNLPMSELNSSGHNNLLNGQ